MDRHIARTIVRNSAGDARVIWSIFSGYHPQGLRESGALDLLFWERKRIAGISSMQTELHELQLSVLMHR